MLSKITARSVWKVGSRNGKWNLTLTSIVCQTRLGPLHKWRIIWEISPTNGRWNLIWTNGNCCILLHFVQLIQDRTCTLIGNSLESDVQCRDQGMQVHCFLKGNADCQGGEEGVCHSLIRALSTGVGRSCYSFTGHSRDHTFGCSSGRLAIGKMLLSWESVVKDSQ